MTPSDLPVRSEKSRYQPSQRRLVLVAVATTLVAWQVTASTMGTVFARSQPRLALAVSPYNAEANGNEAKRLFSESPLRPDWVSITQHARVALMRSPTNVSSWAMLGSASDVAGRREQARQLFVQSDKLSRHDPITQMYLIESAVARGDILSAIQHYNAALSTSRTSADTLMPVLVAASADPAIARPLAVMLQRRPVWRIEFGRRLVSMAQTLGPGFPIVLKSLGLNPRDPTQRGILSLGITRLADAGAVDAAYSLYASNVIGAATARENLRDGGFEAQTRLAPFDWETRDGDSVYAVIQSRGNGNALYVSADNVNSQAAVQRLLLQPGRYQLAAVMGSDDRAGGEIALAMVCVQSAATKKSEGAVASIRLPSGAAEARLQTLLTIPPTGCRTQQLQVLASPAEQSGRQSWIDDIKITPLK